MKVTNRLLDVMHRTVSGITPIRRLKHRLKTIKESVKPDWVSHPENIQIDTHNYCNLWLEGKGCIHCNVKPKGGWNLPRGFMPTEMVHYIMDYWSQHGAYSIALYINGEPLYDERLPQFCSYAQKRGLICLIDTNGTMYERRKNLIHPNLRQVRFSYSATTPETYETVHGAPFFDRVTSTIQWFMKHKLPTQEIILYYITNKYNLSELKPWIKKWMRHHLHLVLFPLHEVEGIQLESTRTRPSQRTYWEEITKELTGRYPTQPCRPIDIFADGQLRIREFPDHVVCQGSNSFSIAWTGQLLHCTDIPYKFNYGHIYDHDMLDVWHQRNLAKINHPACRVCSVKHPQHDEILRRYLT